MTSKTANIVSMNGRVPVPIVPTFSAVFLLIVIFCTLYSFSIWMPSNYAHTSGKRVIISRIFIYITSSYQVQPITVLCITVVASDIAMHAMYNNHGIVHTISRQKHLPHKFL